MNTLIIGGTSGLGLEMARDFAEQGSNVIVTGRHDPKVDFAQYEYLDLNYRELADQIGALVFELPEIQNLVYAAGFVQMGRITDIDNSEIEKMINVGELGLVYSVKSLLEKQDHLDELITITSTSQLTPRKYEAPYTMVKSGAHMFSNSMAEDGRIDKVLVAGPAGMNSPFWKGEKRDDLHTMMDPAWVSEKIMENRLAPPDKLHFRFVKILRATGELPNRVEIAEER